MLITPENANFGSILLELLILTLAFSILGWLISVLYAKHSKVKEISFNHRKLISILVSVNTLLFLFLIYFVLFVVITGKNAFTLSSFPMDETNIYYLILPQIIIFFTLIIIFFTTRNKINKQTKIR